MIIHFLVVWLFSTFSVDGFIMDSHFRSFCTGHYLEFPFGLPADQRVLNESCQQLVPSYSEREGDRITICKRYAPFDVLVAEAVTTPQKMTKCIWASLTFCSTGKKSFMGQCLTQTPAKTFEELKTYCNNTMIRTGSRLEASWLIKLFSSGGMNVWVSNGASASKVFFPKDKTMGYSRSNYDYDKNYGQVSIIGSHDFELGVQYGMLIPTDKNEKLVSFCATDGRAVVKPPVTGPAIGTNGNLNNNVTNNPRIQISPDLDVYMSGVFTIRNTQQKSFVMDVHKMYKHCKKFSRKAFPLIPTYEMLSKLKGMRDHPVFVLGFLSQPADYINSCSPNASFPHGMLQQLFKTHDHNMDDIPINASLWETGFPKPRCSKHAPVAVVLNRNGRLENFPSSARLPLLCGDGVPPQIADIDRCPNKYSIFKNNTCVCMNGTLDIVDTKLPERVNYIRGYYCLPMNPCKENRTDLYFYMIVDESGSINYNTTDLQYDTNQEPIDGSDIVFIGDNWGKHVVPFVNEIIDKIPANYTKDGGIIRFSTWNYPVFTDGWNVTALKEAMMEPYRKGDTRLHLALEVLRTHLETLKFSEKYRLVTVIMTDGKTKSQDVALEEANKIKAMGDSRIIIFNVGDAVGLPISQQLASSPEDVIDELKFDSVSNYIGKLMNLICPPITHGNFTSEKP